MLMQQARKRAQAQQPTAEPSNGATAHGGGYKAPDWKAITPPDMHDAVERVVAAGAKLMYAPDFRDDLRQAIAAAMPVDQKLADNVVGLLLMLDQQSQGGIPVAALFPAGVALMDEAAQVLESAGSPVTQEDFNGGMLRMFALMGKKLGASDDDLMKSMGDMTPDDQGDASTASEPDGDEQGQTKLASSTGHAEPDEDELSAMSKGMA